jgi:uncharacterized protein YndB with AHSA1/START domain
MAEPTEEVSELVVERTADLAAPADAVWDAITDPDLLADWFGEIEFDLSEGGAITTAGAGEIETIGVVERVEAPHRIGFVWIAPGSESPSSVEIVIDRNDCGGSTLRTREVRLGTDWERRPAWFPSTPLSSTNRACASARG